MSNSQMERDSCDFCEATQTGSTKLFKQHYPELTQQIPKERIPNLPESVALIRDIAPINPNGIHLLLLPKDHYLSLATVPNQKILQQARDLICTKLRSSTRKLLLFEHGPGFIDEQPIGCGGCHVDHAHGHFVALPNTLTFKHIRSTTEQKLAQIGWNELSIDSQETTEPFYDITKFTGLNPYLQIGIIDTDTGEKQAVTYRQNSPDKIIESQLLRKIASNLIQKTNDPLQWHWQDMLSFNKNVPADQNPIIRFEQQMRTQETN